MRKKKNPLDPKIFEKARERVETAFPYEGVKKGFYVADPKGASVFGAMLEKATSVVVNIVGDSLNLRLYRPPESSILGVRFKVDERRGINKSSIEIPKGHEVQDHHIPHDVPEDMMRQNNMTIEMVPDGEGGLKPNTDSNGMVKTYINFPDPRQDQK